MRISNINSIGFKGINVSKSSEKKQTVAKGGNDTARILERWKSDFDFLASCYDKYQMPTFREAKRKAEKQKVPFRWVDQRAILKFNNKADAYREFSDSLANRTVYVDQMVKVREQAIKEMHQSEEEVGTSLYVGDSAHKGVEKVAGYKDEIKVLEEEFISKVSEEKAGGNPEIFGSILFFGPNGNGKTHMTKAVAEATDSNIVKVRVPSKRDAFVIKGMEKVQSIAEESEKRFNEDRTRTIIFIDEIDKMIFEGSPVLDEFSEFIKTCSEKYHCSVFAATNNPLSLGLNYDDPDIFPIKMSIDIPNEENAKEVLNYYVDDSADSEIDTGKLVSVMAQNEEEKGGKYSIAKIKQVVIDTTMQPDGVNQQSLEENFVGSIPDLTPEMVEQFERDYNELIGKVW